MVRRLKEGDGVIYLWISSALGLHCRRRRTAIVLIALLERGRRAGGGWLVFGSESGSRGLVRWSQFDWVQVVALVAAVTVERRMPWCCEIVG